MQVRSPQDLPLTYGVDLRVTLHRNHSYEVVASCDQDAHSARCVARSPGLAACGAVNNLHSKMTATVVQLEEG